MANTSVAHWDGAFYWFCFDCQLCDQSEFATWEDADDDRQTHECGPVQGLLPYEEILAEDELHD